MSQVKLDAATRKSIDALCGRYPTRLAALLPALHLVQKQYGFISEVLAQDVADILGVAASRVWEVVTFYTMFHHQPTGKYVIRICRNLACQLRGADRLISKAESLLGIRCGETTADGQITLEAEECLASCGTAPMLWCNDDIVENLDEDKLQRFLAELT